MKLSELQSIVNTYGISLYEFSALLYLCSRDPDKSLLSVYKKLMHDRLVSKDKDIFNITEKGKEYLESILLNKDFSLGDRNRWVNLANSLRELFPTGRKEGTNYMWRDSAMAIARKLKTLHDKFNADFSDEEAINATKKYIESFNGNYKFMQLLKYFILKKDPVKGEETSQLLSFIENADSADVVNFDTGEII